MDSAYQIWHFELETPDSKLSLSLVCLAACGQRVLLGRLAERHGPEMG